MQSILRKASHIYFHY